jgi:hypothetical protein
LIRFRQLAPAAFAAAALAACSTYDSAVDTLGGAVDTLDEALATPEPSPKIPSVDLSSAVWRKLSPDQPDSNPVRVAVVARDDKIGATRVVLKVPPSFPLPPYWLNAQGTYTVLKGTFVFEGLDADGHPQKVTQGPGAFAIVPAKLIQRGTTQGREEGLLYITVYGDWAPSFADGAFVAPTLRAGS